MKEYFSSFLSPSSNQHSPLQSPFDQSTEQLIITARLSLFFHRRILSGETQLLLAYQHYLLTFFRLFKNNYHREATTFELQRFAGDHTKTQLLTIFIDPNSLRPTIHEVTQANVFKKNSPSLK